MGVFPTGFKVARVIPLIKRIGLDMNDTASFRPISNLPFLSKVFECLVLKRLNCHLHFNSLLPVYQSAYPSGCSTETALLRVVNDIIGSIDAKKVVLLALLDMSAAFDTVDHRYYYNYFDTITTLVTILWYRWGGTQLVWVLLGGEVVCSYF